MGEGLAPISIRRDRVVFLALGAVLLFGFACVPRSYRLRRARTLPRRYDALA
jgi:hypothetical protein